MLKILMVMVIVLAAINLNKINAAETTTTTTSTSKHGRYKRFLKTETAVIDVLREYIENFEEEITVIRRKMLEIKDIHTVALNDVDKYVSNPLNALIVLKRFAIDWNILQKMANRLLNNTDEIAEDRNAMMSSLKFPTEDNFDETVGILLRLQDLYNMDAERIANGKLNGIKFGPEMSWSDCLALGRKSEESGYFQVAKFWIETAMEKLPALDSPPSESNANNTSHPSSKASQSNETQNSEVLQARFEILQELLNAEFHMANFARSLEIANEMLSLRPQHKGVIEAKQTIEKTLKREAKKLKNKRPKKSKNIEKSKKAIKKKSTEAMLIEDICRATTMAPHRAAIVSTTSDANSQKCYLDNGNLNALKLSPIKLEILSHDPYIVLHHDVLSGKEVESIKQLMEKETTPDDVRLKFTNLGQKKLRRLNEKLQRHTGHAWNSFGEWQPQIHTFEMSAMEETATGGIRKQREEINANVILNLQMAKLGGSIVFPQLQLSCQIPDGALLYWSNLNEFQEVDYRIKHHVCPVIDGKQIAAVSTVRRV